MTDNLLVHEPVIRFAVFAGIFRFVDPCTTAVTL